MLTCASTYEPIWSLTAATASAGAVSSKSRQDFSEELYDSCVRNHGPDRYGLSSLHSTWFAVLHAVFTFTDTGRVTKEQWLGGLAAAMLSNRIECMPGSHCSHITYRRVVKLVGQAPPTRVIVARPGSLKRAAIEAEISADRPAKRQVIDLGSNIPFTQVPKIIDEGFRAQEKILAKGNQKIMEHYHVARHCLEECLGDPLCDLLLMLVLTVSSSSVTPMVRSKGHEFEAGPRKEPRIFAAGLVTRMLWFLRPDAFPWEEDDGQVLRISEMTKKIEHKGISNRVLRELGWVKVLGKRDNPRNSEVQLRAEAELLKLRAELLRLRRDPAGFIARVFHSHDSVWVERCSEIIQERR
jgi:hypothetical protein